MLSFPAIDTLQPRFVDGLYLFKSDSTRLVKLDLLFEAGSAYQHKKLCASAAVKLCTMATTTMDSAAVAEFMDFRGILVETDSQVQQSQITFYFLRDYAEELMPIVRDMITCPAFSAEDFEVWRKHRRQEILSAEQKTSTIARRNFYLNLFGPGHPLGRYATVSDLDLLTIEDIRAFLQERYKPENMTVVLAGAIDDALIQLVNDCIPRSSISTIRPSLEIPPQVDSHFHILHSAIDSATQTSVRVGRILPIPWSGYDYVRFMLLTTVLGGYFGSRLMSNLREDKGYTYGIYSRTQIYRGVIVFFIAADVSGGKAEEAVREVRFELQRLSDELVTDEELDLVKMVMAGDFLRSVDGIFERSARFCDMYATCVTEGLTENLKDALQMTTPSELRDLAMRYLQPDSMLVCTAGL